MRKKGLLILFAILAAICASFALSGCGLIGGGNGSNGGSGNGGTGGGGKPSDEHTHSYVETVVAPTCTKKGYTLHKCSCGDEYKDNEKEVLGHLFGEWNVTTPATEEKDGEETRTCTRENCEYIEMRKIPKLDHTHSYTETVVEPTCTTKGYTLHKCSCGDEYKDNETPALDHSFTNYVSDGNATCTKDGTKTAKCDRCDETKTIADEGSAKGHDYSTEWTVDKEATCQKTGIKSHHCTRCEAKTDETEILFAAHTYDDEICTVCGAVELIEATGLEYTLSEDKTYYIVSEMGDCTRKHFIIPATYNGLPVKEIGEMAFYNKYNIIQVVLPDSITIIRYEAFAFCGSLTSVTIGNGVTSIGEWAFFYCGSLTSITIPDSVTSVGKRAFSDCSSLTSVTIGNGVTGIGNYAFGDCSSLTSVTIGNGVTSIGDGAFSDCSSLTSVTIGNGVTNIGDFAFNGCGLLTSITIPDSVTSIDSSAFYGCDKLIKGVKGVSYVDKWVVGCDTSVTKVELKADTVGIADGAFAFCRSLTSINASEESTYFKTIDGNLYTKDGKALIQYARGKTDTHFFIPDRVTSIGDYAFYGCSSLNSVTIGNGVTSIGDYAFYGCSSLPSVTIGNGVTSIGEWAFRGCSLLTSIIIPDSVTSIGYGAFYNCRSLTGINVSEGNKNFKTLNGDLYTKDGKTLIKYASGKTDKLFFIPDSVESIGEYAFNYCSSLTSVTIPDSVESIGEYAFHVCSSLTSVTIPDSVTSIGDGVFLSCDSLTSVTIPDSVTSIGESAFGGCNSLTSIMIPDSVLSIGFYAFNPCTSLTSVTIGNGVTSIGVYAFEDCKVLTSIIFNGTIEEWKKIEKGYGWNDNTGNFTVHCTDGDLTKEEA